MKTYKNMLVMFADLFIIFISFSFGVLVVDEFYFVPDHYLHVLREIPFVIIAYFVTFQIFGMYKSLWKYASIEELIRGILANVIALNVAYLVMVLIQFTEFNYAYYLVTFFLITTGTVGMRLSYRLYKFYIDYRQDQSEKKRTLIVGAGQAGVMLYEEILQNREFDKHVVGFVDDNQEYLGRRIRGVPVLGTTDDITEIAFEYDIDTVVIAIPSLGFLDMKRLLNKVEATGCQIKMMPPFYEMIGSKSDVLNVRDVQIEDLLGREPIQLDESGIQDFIKGKTILVTGGGGSIGSELVRQLCRFSPKRIVIVDIYENNAYDLQMELKRTFSKESGNVHPDIVVLIASVRDQKKMKQIMEKYQPHIVFHAAAHKHVPLMETSPEEAIKNNVLGTYNVAMASIASKVEKFVLISTDKAVRPTNVMGASKRIAEKIIMKLNPECDTEFIAVRFGNILGSSGSVIPLFKKQIQNGGPVTVTHPEITRYFMTIPEACQLVIQAGAFAHGGELFVLDMGKPVKILDLAEKLIRLSGHEPYRTIDIEFTGLRLGEKMYEELLIDLDNVIRTPNRAIFIEKNNNNFDEILDEVKWLEENINDFDPIAFVKRNVKSYHS